MKFVFLLVFFFIGSVLQAHTAIDELKNINVFLSEPIENQQAHPLCKQAEGLLSGKTSGISKQYATVDERLVALETLFQEENHNYATPLKSCAKAFEKSLKSHEIGHLVALSFMKSVVSAVYSGDLIYESHQSFLNLIFEGKQNVFNSFGTSFFSNYFLEVKQRIDSYTLSHLRILFPESMHSLIKRFAPKKDTQEYIQINIEEVDPFFVTETSSVEDDHLLANILQEEEDNRLEGYKGVEDLNNFNADHLLAILLQEELNRQPILCNLKKDITAEDRGRFQAILNDYTKIRFDWDVHKMTQSFCRPHYAAIRDLEKKYLGITSDKVVLSSFSDYRKNIEAVIRANPETFAARQDAITASLNNIQAYWQNPVDGETSQSLVEVFQYTYWVAQEFGDDYLFLLFDKLAENKETGGGCHPGITGRLIAFYFQMIAWAFEGR